MITYDIMNTLYWNPDVRIVETRKTKVSIFTSDQKMSVKTVVEGMNFNQMAGHGETKFVVY
ncbi:MAG: hypothetical protein R6V23_03895 [Bacteroidales bacterium]